MTTSGADAAEPTIADLELAAYARAIEAGKSEEYAEAFAKAYATSYLVGFEQGLEQGIEAGSTAERERLRTVMAGHATQGVEAKRWLLALALDAPVDADVVATPNDHHHPQ